MGISFANICRCIETDCHPNAANSTLERSHDHHHTSGHHHNESSGQSEDDSVPHYCDHSAEPMVQVNATTEIPLLPLLMIFVEYLNLDFLGDFAQEYAFVDTSPPLPRCVLIEHYRPLLI